MVIDCSQNRVTNHELFCLLKDKLHDMIGLQVEEDDHFLMLKDKDKVIARWSVTGVTVEEIQDTANSYIVNNYIDLKLKLLLFWGRHPQAKFNLDCIASALDTTKTSLRDTIRVLVEEGTLKEQLNGTGITNYSLNNNQQAQEYIKELARLDWNEIKILKNQLQEEAIPV